MTTRPAESGSADPVPSVAAAAPDALSDSVAPAPTAATLRLRQSVPAQLVRFGVINLKMLRLALKSHK